MSNEIVRFSRLLRIFKLNYNPAYIIELEKNNQKNLYISYSNINLTRFFERYEKTKLKKEFKDLSDRCLMGECTNASLMFAHSPITHFEADCSSLVDGHSMFSRSNIRLIKTEFPLLESGSWMFYKTKIKEMSIDFPKLKNGYFMFADSSLEKITSKFPLLEVGESMFKHTQLKEINCQFPKLEDKIEMFDGTPFKLKQNYPHYFV